MAENVEESVQEALKDLELLAWRLPEENQRFVFTDDLLRPFITALLEGTGGSLSKAAAVKGARRGIGRRRS